MGSTSKNKFAGAQRASVAPHARPRQGSLPGRAPRGRLGRGGGRSCRWEGGFVCDRALSDGRVKAGIRRLPTGLPGAGGAAGGAPTSPTSPKLSSGPPRGKSRRCRRRREPPERSRGPPGVPASLPLRRARPRPPPRSGRPPAIRHPLPSPRRRPLTHPRPASAATGASCPRSLPPVKLSPASLRPSSPRPAPPSPPGAAATARALPRRSRAPPRPHLALPPPPRGSGGRWGQRRRLRAVPASGEIAPPRPELPGLLPAGTPREARGAVGRAVPGCAVPGAGGHGRRDRLLPLGEARSDLGVAAGKLGSFPGRAGRDHAALSGGGGRSPAAGPWSPAGSAVEPGWQRRERLQAGRVPSVSHDPSAAPRSKCAGSDNPGSEERCSVCEIEKRM